MITKREGVLELERNIREEIGNHAVEGKAEN
jgi:hypothetical protein